MVYRVKRTLSVPNVEKGILLAIVTKVNESFFEVTPSGVRYDFRIGSSVDFTVEEELQKLIFSREIRGIWIP